MSISFLQGLLISTFVLLVLLYLYYSRSNSRSKLPTNWPVLHMLPSCLTNLHNFYDYLAVVLAGSGLSFRAHGPPGTGMRFFFTGDPENVRHIFTTNYVNFPKGAQFAAIFDVMAGSLFTIDGETSHRMHAKAQKFFSSRPFVGCVAARCRDKVEHGVLPFLAHMANTRTPFDMQELMGRCMLDLTSLMVFGVDPGLLGTNMSSMDVSDAMDTTMEVAFLRNFIPVSCWKAMRWLNIGPERKLRAAHRVLHRFVEEMTESWKMNARGVVYDDEVDNIMSDCVNNPLYADDEVLRASLIGSMLAGRDTVGTTLSWMFYNLAQNPGTVSIIRNELSSIASRKIAGGTTGAMVIFDPEETKPLTYLRAALYETLRLYPPGPIERKTVVSNDIMPSGHDVHAGDTICISIHSMGRMEGIWGKDCLNYNPDRWLSEDGNKLSTIPSHKFLAFNSGPRICPGKEIAIMQMKTIVAAVVWNFDMEVVEGQSIQPKMSCLLQMKNGLTMMLKKAEM